MIIWIVAKLTGGQVVWVKYHDGEVRKTIARRTPFGETVAKCMWLFGSSMTRLHADGTASGSYVVAWKPVRGNRSDG